jgi:hypothetical protein
MSKLPSFDEECFFISPIGEPESDTRRRADDVRDYIVGPAVAELGLKPVRADDIAKPGQITLQVIEHVLKAKAAITDLTGANANVFYELAVRHTAQLPVVLLAHEDDRGKLPFDIAPMRTIFYDHHALKSAADCQAEIRDQLASALEDGTVDSPVAASANLARLQGGNSSEQVLAQLVGAVQGFAAQLDDVGRAVASVGSRSGYGPISADTIEAYAVRLDTLAAQVSVGSAPAEGVVAELDRFANLLWQHIGQDAHDDRATRRRRQLRRHVAAREIRRAAKGTPAADADGPPL